MDNSQLPLIKKSMEKAAAYEAAGDTVNAEKWLNIAMKYEEYYAKQDNKTAEQYYRDKYGT